MEQSNSRLRHSVRRLPLPPGRLIPHHQAGTCLFCGALELDQHHGLSLLCYGNLRTTCAAAQHAARAAAPDLAYPPFSSPSFASARRRLCHVNLPVNPTTSSLMSKKSPSQLSSRNSYLIVFANHCDVRFSNVKAQISFICVGECAIY